MSTQPRFAPTRRTVLRTAAWTAPAVSIAVAAPAYATGSPLDPPVMGGLVVTRSGTILNVTTSLAGGGTSIGPVDAQITFMFTGGNSKINQNATVNSPWVFVPPRADYVAKFRTTTVAATPATSFAAHVDLNNSSFTSVKVTVVFTWPGGQTSLETTHVK
jgi:hypothetical protein